MGRAAVIFPGQGAQFVGMGKDVFASSKRAAEVFEKANELLGFDLKTICFEGPEEKLECTDIQQPAILVTGIAYMEALSERGNLEAEFQATGGLSLGEYTALYFAGSLSFEDAVKLVRKRGELMQAAAEANPSSMVSLIGADEAKAEELCQKAAQGEVLVPANLNCPGQVVISGAKGACARAVELADEVGCRAVALKVAGAFHSPLMQSAADELGQVLASTTINEPRIPVLSNVTSDYHSSPDSIRELLQKQVTSPVRWQASVERLLGEGYDRFVEAGPGRVLTGMMRKIDRKAPTANVGTVDQVGAFEFCN